MVRATTNRDMDRLASVGTAWAGVRSLPTGLLVLDRSDRVIATSATWDSVFEALDRFLALPPESDSAPFWARVGRLAEASAALRSYVSAARQAPVPPLVLRFPGDVAIQLQGGPLESPHGATSFLAHDVSDAVHQAEEATYWRALLESQNEASMDGILIVDPLGRVLSVNRRFMELWGLPEDALRPGEPDAEALDLVLERLADPEEFLTRIDWLVRNRNAVTRDEIAFKDGRWFERWSTPVESPGGEYFGRGWYFRDISERRQQEHALQEAYGELQGSALLRQRMLQTISHDLGTPLTPIRIQLDLLRRHVAGDDAAVNRCLEMLDRNVAQVTRMVQDLRDLALLQEGRLRVMVQPEPLGRIVIQAANGFRGAADKLGVQLQVAIEADGVVRVDAQRLVQILYNLFSNAAKFSPNPSVVDVSVRAEPGAGLAIRVRDCGRGLRPEETDLLFQPFSQVHAPDESKEAGTGLGLYICRGLLEAMHGSIDVESEGLGHGSTFVIQLPLANSA